MTRVVPVRPPCPRRRAACGVLLALGAAGATSAASAAERLLDLAAPRQVRLDLRWTPFDAVRLPDDGEFHRMTAQVPSVEVRLDVSRHVGRTARVWLVVPPDAGVLAPPGMELRWIGRGALRSGQARAGERAAVFEGVVREPLLADILDLQVVVDSRFFTGRLRSAPYFELESY